MMKGYRRLEQLLRQTLQICPKTQRYRNKITGQMNGEREGKNWSLSGWGSGWMNQWVTQQQNKWKEVQTYRWTCMMVFKNMEVSLRRVADVTVDSSEIVKFNHCVKSISCKGGSPSKMTKDFLLHARRLQHFWYPSHNVIILDKDKLLMEA